MTELVVADAVTDLPVGARVATEDRALLIVGGRPTLHLAGEEHELLAADELTELADSALRLAEEHTERARDPSVTGPALQAAMLASAAKLETLSTASRFLRSVAALRAARAVVGAAPVTWFDQDPAFAAAAARAVGVMELTHARPVQARDGRGERIVNWLKARRLDWTVRYLSTLPGVAGRRRMTGKLIGSSGALTDAAAASEMPGDLVGPVVLLFDVRNSGMIANLAAVANAVQARGVACVGIYMEPRVARLLEREHPTLPIVPLAAFGGGSVIRSVVAATLPVRAALKAMVAQDNANMEQETPDVVATRRFLAGGLSRSYVAQGLVDLISLQSALETLRPSAVLTSSDAHRYSRLAVLSSSRNRVRTMVVQHGATVGERIYLPVTADVMAAWGSWCQSWFISRGVAPNRVVAAGYPRGDVYSPVGNQSQAQVRSGDRRHGTRVRRLLFAAQPIPDDVTSEFLQRVFAVVDECEDLHLTIRPHPGESRRGLLTALVNDAPPGVSRRVRLSAAGLPLTSDLETADVVVTSESTVGIDALGADLPLVLLTHPALRRAIPFADFGACKVASDAVDLKRVLASLEAEDEVYRLQLGGRSFLAAYVGPVGESAAGNVAAALLGERWPW